jgi:flagellar hook-associated protein 3 FlgL
MNSVGVPTLLSHLRLSGATAELRRQSEAARIEMVTGRIDDLSAALGRRLGEAQILRKAVDDIVLQRETIARAELRSAVSQSVLADIRTGASGVNADLLAAIGRGDEQAIGVASLRARDALETAFSRLNVRVEGRSAFAGDDNDGPALKDAATLLADVAAIYAGAGSPAQVEADLDFYFNDPAGGYATSIYRGGVGDLASLEVATGETVVGTARANELAIKDSLRGLSMLAVAGGAPPSAARDATLATAGATLLKGADGALDLMTRIGIEQQRTASARTRLESEEAALTEAYNALTARDPYEAASRLQAIEAQIEASYVATSRLSRLSLANFL